jgi:hypothetical protein
MRSYSRRWKLEAGSLLNYRRLVGINNRQQFYSALITGGFHAYLLVYSLMSAGHVDPRRRHHPQRLSNGDQHFKYNKVPTFTLARSGDLLHSAPALLVLLMYSLCWYLSPCGDWDWQGKWDPEGCYSTSAAPLTLHLTPTCVYLTFRYHRLCLTSCSFRNYQMPYLDTDTKRRDPGGFD